jgi:hypothetical protein
MLEPMARAALKCVMAALIAVLMAQAAAPSARLLTPIEIVCCAQAEQQAPRKIVLIRADKAIRQEIPAYAFRPGLAPDLSDLFQRPPPSASPLAYSLEA